MTSPPASALSPTTGNLPQQPPPSLIEREEKKEIDQVGRGDQIQRPLPPSLASSTAAFRLPSASHTPQADPHPSISLSRNLSLYTGTHLRRHRCRPILAFSGDSRHHATPSQAHLVPLGLFPRRDSPLPASNSHPQPSPWLGFWRGGASIAGAAPATPAAPPQLLPRPRMQLSPLDGAPPPVAMGCSSSSSDVQEEGLNVDGLDDMYG